MRKALFLLVVLGFVSQVKAQVICYVESPGPVIGNKEMSWADPAGGWGCPDLNIPGNAILDTLAFAIGGDSLCCSAITNGAQINGKIAVIYRGTCEFGAKALAAQTAGAVGVIIINNIPGSPIAMGAGAVGATVTIPVVMLTQADGALLRSSILGGNCTAFIGSKFGFYPNDIGIWPKDFILPPATSNPYKVAQNASEFGAAVGSWVFNFGQNTQYNVTLKGSITYGGGSIYSQTSSPATILPGDSLWIQLPWFSQATYNAGLYKMSYSINADSADDFMADNYRRADFTISNDLFSYATIDTVTLMPITNATYRAAGGGTEFEACIHFRDSLASRLATEGLYFVASTPAADSLTNVTIESRLYEWNDVFTDVNGTVTMDLLNPVAFGNYVYASNLQNVQVYVPWQTPYTLQDSVRYLFCVHTFDPFVYFGYGTTNDYDEHLNQYLQPISPVSDDGTYNWLGFGTDVVPSIGARIIDVNTLGNESLNTLSNANAYPNPASNIVYIPMKVMTGEMEIAIMDMQGSIIKSEIRKITNAGSLPVNIDGVANGTYIIRLTTVNGGLSQSFKIMINN